MRDFEFDEVIGILKNYVKKKIAAVVPQEITVTESIKIGTELADITVDGDSNKIYMPAVKVNGQEQTVENDELDLDVANNLITPAQWEQIQTILS